MPQAADRYEVVWPRSTRQVKVSKLAQRPGSLDGLRIAHLWDYLFRGDEVFAALETGLRAAFPKVEFVSWQEFGSTHGQDERQVLATLPQRLRELKVDAVISGMGC